MVRTFPEFGYDPVTGEWNDSLLGDFLWSNVNTSEALPDVMTPSTWSLWQYYYVDTNPIRLPEEYPFCGNLAGRAYLNLSLAISLYRSVGKDIRREMHADIIGLAQTGMDVPLIPFPPLAAIWMVLPGMLKARRFARRDPQRLAAFLSSNPGWCRARSERVQGIAEKTALLTFWNEELKPRFQDSCRYLRSVTMLFTDPATRLRLELQRLVGENDSGTILSNLAGESAGLESLGPLVGLAQVGRGELSRAAYMERYGHRGPHELELYAPGAEEDPDWLEKKLTDFLLSPTDVSALLASQRAKSREAWRRLELKSPRKAGRLQQQLKTVAAAARAREAVRSEVTRLTRLVRRFVLRAGQSSGLEDGVFFLSLGEIEAALSGVPAGPESIAVRQQAYRRQSALPPYPPVIIGRFDPYHWAADPQRRSDLFDSRQTAARAVSAVIRGFPGAAGRVEGLVRRIDKPEEGSALRPGEVLVTATTNIGWTPLFPRLAAVVTDVGAPLSHAAIVARELGIPAVVGCGDATARLKTGDRVRVDGARGLVEILGNGSR